MPIDNTQSDENYLEVKDLIKWFGDDPAVDGISFKIAKGDFLTFSRSLGMRKNHHTNEYCRPSFDRRRLNKSWRCDVYRSRVGNFMAPENRGIGMVFQSYAIWPHMSVTKMVAYPL